MNTKQWAVFFVVALSFDYTTATFFRKYKGVSKKYADDNDGYYGWSSGCRCNEDLTSELDEALENTKRSLSVKYKKGCSVTSTSLEEYEFTDGQLKGIHKFQRKGPYRCSLSRNYVRIFFKIGFFDLLIHYTVSLVEDILGGFLGGVASFIGRILGSISNFLFRIVIPELYCTVVLIKNFGGHGGFKIEGLYLNEIQKVSFTDKRFSKHHSTIGPYFLPICDHVMHYTFNNIFHGVLTKHVSKVSAEYDSFYYASSSKRSYGDNYEESSESGGGYSYKYESSDSDSSYDD